MPSSRDATGGAAFARVSRSRSSCRNATAGFLQGEDTTRKPSSAKYDAVLVNDNFRARQPANYPAEPVRIDVPLSSKSGPQVIARDVVDDGNAHRHDSRKLASVLLALYDERAIARRRPRTVAKTQ